MCDAFVGTWKLVSSENFDDYMKEVGKERPCGGAGLIHFSLGKSDSGLFFTQEALTRYEMLLSTERL